MSSPSKRGGPILAVFIEFENGDIKEWKSLSRKKVIEIINKYQVDYVGTDNPLEILFEKESLANFVRRLSSKTNFIHINLTKSGKTIPFRKLVKEYLPESLSKKMNPIETANLIVKLMKLKVGMVLEPFEDETIIDIGQPNKSKKGGWSQSRYEHQNREVVLRVAKEIRHSLKEKNLEFDELTNKGKYGAKKSRFHVFAPRNIVYGIINKRSLFPAKIKIWSPKKQVISHKPLSYDKQKTRERFYSHIQRLIVGIDPGMTTGVAILNLSGKIVKVFSKKNLSKGELVSELTNYGIPVAICSDVNPAPNFVQKLASTYNAELFQPQNEISQDEKREIVKKYYNNKTDSHQRDALAACLKAFNRFRKNFEKLKSANFSHSQLDMSRGLLIRGLPYQDVISAIKLLSLPKIEKDEYIENQISSNTHLLGRLSNLLEELTLTEERISNLRAHSGRLEAKIYSQQNFIKRQKTDLTKLYDKITLKFLKSEIIEMKERQIDILKNQIRDQKQNNEILLNANRELEKIVLLKLEDDHIPIKILKSFSYDGIYELINNKVIDDGDIIIILDVSGGGPQTSKYLSETKLKMVFYNGNFFPDHAKIALNSTSIPYISADNYSITKMDTFATIKLVDFHRAIDDYKKNMDLEKRMKQKRDIEITIENYQFEREKELVENIANYDEYELDDEYDDISSL